jgi:hypothetical protein
MFAYGFIISTVVPSSILSAGPMGREVLVTLVLEGGTYLPGNENTLGGGATRSAIMGSRSITNAELWEMYGLYTARVALAVMFVFEGSSVPIAGRKPMSWQVILWPCSAPQGKCWAYYLMPRPFSFQIFPDSSFINHPTEYTLGYWERRELTH